MAIILWKRWWKQSKGFLDCLKSQYPLCFSLFRGNMRWRTSSPAHCVLLSGFTAELPGRSGSTTKGLIALHSYTVKGKTDSERSRVPRWSFFSKSAYATLTPALLPEYFWDWSNSCLYFGISFSLAVWCPGGPEPCCLHSFINGVLASLWKEVFFVKSVLVNGMLETLPSQPPCSLP